MPASSIELTVRCDSLLEENKSLKGQLQTLRACEDRLKKLRTVLETVQVLKFPDHALSYSSMSPEEDELLLLLRHCYKIANGGQS